MQSIINSTLFSHSIGKVLKKDLFSPQIVRKNGKILCFPDISIYDQLSKHKNQKQSPPSKKRRKKKDEKNKVVWAQLLRLGLHRAVVNISGNSQRLPSEKVS
jgi:hypothetical protein